MRIGIVAALPGELKPLVRGWERLSSPVKGLFIWIKTKGEDEYIAVCSGMGTQAVLRSFTAAEHIGTLDMVLSVGWAGALDEGMKAGHCYIASEVIDARTGERFSFTEGGGRQRLVTTPHVADEAEKVRLHDTYEAALVDMEAAAVARLAQMREIPICCFKAVSDGKDARLPNLNRFIDLNGQLQMLPFLAYVAVRPRYWSSLMKLGRTSHIAAEALAGSILKFLEEKNVDRINRTGAV